MTAPSLRSLSRCSALVAAAVLLGPALAAPPPPAPRPPARWEPAALTLPENRISLLEAVRITLENDPNIRVAEQQSYGSYGVFQTESGTFDSSLSGSAQWLFTQQALTATQKTAEQKKRDDLDKSISDQKVKVDEAAARVTEMQKLQADPYNYQMKADEQLLTVQLAVDLFNQKIAAETDPAKKQQLIQARDTYIQARLLGFQSAQASAQTTLTGYETDRANLGDVPRTVQQHNVTLDLKALFPYRDGVTLGIVANGTYASNDYKGKPKQPELGGLGIEDLYNVSVGFSVAASLLRGRGSDATGAFEKAAGIDYEASELAFRHQATASVFNTVSAYWNLVASQEIYEAMKRASANQDKRLEITDALIAGDEIPRAERARALASAAADRSTLAAARRTVEEARLSLAIAMGIAVASGANAPYAADGFPKDLEKDLLADLQAPALWTLALERRYDRRASIRLIDSGGVLLRQAETALRPKLDVNGQVSATSAAETSMAQLANGWTAPSIQAGLDFEVPIGNNAARGTYRQRQADYLQRSINATDLDRNIRANVVQLLASLRAAAEQVEQSKEAVLHYEKTIEAEADRFKSGESTLLDSILTQDLQTTANVTLAQAQQTYASLLARLRFETGTLVEEAGVRNIVREDDLLRLPRAARNP